jgi:GLPGLI family protein
MKKYFLLFACHSLLFLTHAQTQFFSTVKIEFEKTVAQHAFMKELDPQWYEFAKDHVPANNVTYFDFVGDSAHSIYKPGRETGNNQRNWFDQLGAKNIVYTDYSKSSSISQKPVYEETFLVQDSLLKIKWKITPDTRNIAGFQCRKAVGILFDTVAVFAFYSEELMIPGGPEGIHGLPGMILGMGIPRLHATWFATKVQVVGVPVSQIHPETKGKKVNRKDMLETIYKVMKDWDVWGKKMLLVTQI